ncbi:DUF6122 family protein [Marinicella litoralis]|uniref:LexA-binding, inner membrane-associated hydrolase n=1 Tax=Marinicella litoralis TaxID=644220 RepID=A0A4R6XRN7_9GAMM|nr:DUF6122 family protein [Marinicella litoralis]TDR22396.1 hypothetical protein C8D91_0884 [Marinicella litoralis]
MLHLSLHFIIPLLLALMFYRRKWFTAWLIMLLTMLVDLDHLLANPIYDPNRCSIGFHPMHHPVMTVLYVLLVFYPKTRLIGLGLVIHMMLDGIDCQFMG